MSVKEIMEKLDSLDAKVSQLIKDNTVLYLENQSLKERIDELLLSNSVSKTGAKE